MSSISTTHLAQLLADAAKATDSPGDITETLDVLCRGAKETVPGIDSVSVTRRRPDGTFETVAATDSLSLECDRLQYESGEGPCMDAAAGSGLVLTVDVGSDRRWRRYGPLAAGRFSVMAQLAYTMYAAQHTFGGLNLYSTSTAALDEEALALAELFATQGAVAMGHRRTVDQLSDGLNIRQVIGQATGLIMERYGLDESRAFEFLSRMSQAGNIKLREIADEVVQSANQKARNKTSTPE
jgi:hypothetical protein